MEMNQIVKKISAIALISVLVLMVFGCGKNQDQATEDKSAVPTQVSNIKEIPSESIEPEVTSSETPEPSPSPTPEPTEVAVASDLPQLNLGDRFFPAKSLEGIDPLKDKVVALTFDDGPHPELTPKLLDILKENDAIATFFVLGNRVEKHPEILVRMLEEGNEIGNHSYDHTDLKKLSVDRIVSEQYGKTNDIIEEAVGKRALIDRPPYGSMTEEIAQQLGREQIMWAVDPEDWKPEYKNANSIYDNVINGTNTGIKVTDGAVVLSHDIHKPTIDAYDKIIKELKNQGYKFVTVTQMIQIAELRGKEIKFMFNGAPIAGSAAEPSEKPSSKSSEGSVAYTE